MPYINIAGRQDPQASDGVVTLISTSTITPAVATMATESAGVISTLTATVSQSPTLSPPAPTPTPTPTGLSLGGKICLGIGISLLLITLLSLLGCFLVKRKQRKQPRVVPYPPRDPQAPLPLAPRHSIIKRSMGGGWAMIDWEDEDELPPYPALSRSPTYTAVANASHREDQRMIEELRGPSQEGDSRRNTFGLDRGGV